MKVIRADPYVVLMPTLEEATLTVCQKLVDNEHEELANTVLEFLEGELDSEAIQRIRSELELESD